MSSVNTSTPFIVDINGLPMPHACAFLRKRHAGQLEQFSFKRLAFNSIAAFASDLSYFLNTYKEPSPELLEQHVARNSLLVKYMEFLESPDANLKATTINRRLLIAKEFTTYLREEFVSEGSAVTYHASSLRKTLIGDSERPIIYFKTASIPSARRRSPNTIYILPPDKLRDFFSSFYDPVHKSIAKLIYATGMRRSEAAKITAAQVSKMKELFPGGPAHLTIVGKGNKERTLEIEPMVLEMLRKMLISKARLTRIRRSLKTKSMSADQVPLYLTRFGEPMTGEAIGDAFKRASERSSIKRTPHELRHEFATQYLLVSYRELSKKLSVDKLDSWLARLMIDQTSLTIEKLARLLGHSSSETTKSIYLVALLTSEPSLRDAWCRHLDELGG